MSREHYDQPSNNDDLRATVKRLEAELSSRKGFRFQPSISFDGVAIIVAVIVAAVAWGQLTTTVKRQGEDIQALQVTTGQHTVEITDLKARVPIIRGP